MAGTSTRYRGWYNALRRSHFIRRQQATNIKPAIRLAEKLNTPLNRFVTINFNHTDCDADAVSVAFASLRERFTRWFRGVMRAEGIERKAAFIWVIENAGGQVAVHWLVHVPDTLLGDFSTRLSRWLEKVTGGIHCCESAINIKPAHTPLGAGKYMMKGIDPVFADFYRIRHIPQGLVYGKRCGFSQNLGPSSCRRERTYYSQIRQDRYRRPVAETPPSALA